MKAIATLCLLSLLTGVPGWQEVEPDIQGVYDMVWVDGQSLPTGRITSGSLEFKADGTWRIRMFNGALIVTSSIWGGYSADEEKEGCTQFKSWRNNPPEVKVPNIICDGVLTWRDSHWGADAVFKKRR